MIDVYPPSEDSFLIAKHIPKNLKGKDVLDLGCGTGILAITATKNGANVLAADINPEALKATEVLAREQNVKVKTIQSDLFSNIKNKFDLILFNSPYVPSDENDKYLSKGMKLACTSGEEGKDLINRFLKEFKNHLKESGEVLMIISSKNKIELKEWKEIDSEKFFFEKISLMHYIATTSSDP